MFKWEWIKFKALSSFISQLWSAGFDPRTIYLLSPFIVNIWLLLCKIYGTFDAWCSIDNAYPYYCFLFMVVAWFLMLDGYCESLLLCLFGCLAYFKFAHEYLYALLGLFLDLFLDLHQDLLSSFSPKTSFYSISYSSYLYQVRFHPLYPYLN